jgi:putative transposase
MRLARRNRSPARDGINAMLEAGLLDDVMRRADAGELAVTGEGRSLFEIVKASVGAGLQTELTAHSTMTTS